MKNAVLFLICICCLSINGFARNDGNREYHSHEDFVEPPEIKTIQIDSLTQFLDYFGYLYQVELKQCKYLGKRFNPSTGDSTGLLLCGPKSARGRLHPGLNDMGDIRNFDFRGLKVEIKIDYEEIFNLVETNDIRVASEYPNTRFIISESFKFWTLNAYFGNVWLEISTQMDFSILDSEGNRLLDSSYLAAANNPFISFSADTMMKPAYVSFTFNLPRVHLYFDYDPLDDYIPYHQEIASPKDNIRLIFRYPEYLNLAINNEQH